MSFESPKFEQPLKSAETEKKEKKKEGSEKKERGLLFEVRKRLGEFDVSVGIKKGKEPVRGNVDFENKKVNIRVTPEGVQKTLEVANAFLERPDVEGRIKSWTEKIEEKRKKLRERDAEKTLKGYADQEGKEEGEVVEELLDELESEDLENKEAKKE